MAKITEMLRGKIKSHGNIADLARKTGISQQILQRFSAGNQANLRLDTAEKLLTFFNFRIDRNDYRLRVSALAKEIEEECKELDSPKLRSGLYDLYQILKEHPDADERLRNASLGMYQLFTSWDDAIRSIRGNSTKLKKLIHLPITGK